MKCTLWIFVVFMEIWSLWSGGWGQVNPIPDPSKNKQPYKQPENILGKLTWMKTKCQISWTSTNLHSKQTTYDLFSQIVTGKEKLVMYRNVSMKRLWKTPGKPAVQTMKKKCTKAKLSFRYGRICEELFIMSCFPETGVSIRKCTVREITQFNSD